MRCTVCGEEFGITHACPGPGPAAEQAALEPAPRLRFAPLHYFGEAFGVALWDELAIQRAARDNNAILYGLIFLALAVLLGALPQLASALAAGVELPWGQIVVGILVRIALGVALAFVQYGLCHLLALRLFHAKGRYVGVLRPLLLGTVVQWLVIIPVVGTLAAGIWSVAVVMWVFEEVDGIERMQAFGLSFATGILFWVILFALFGPFQ